MLHGTCLRWTVNGVQSIALCYPLFVMASTVRGEKGANAWKSCTPEYPVAFAHLLSSRFSFFFFFFFFLLFSVHQLTSPFFSAVII